MAANTTPIFTLSPVIGIAQISTANTNRDGSGTLGTVVTPGANGTRIEAIEVCATVNTTVGVVRLFIYDGANNRLWKEIMVPAISGSTTIEIFRDVFVPTVPLVLPSTYLLKASTEKAETFNVFAFGGDY